MIIDKIVEELLTKVVEDAFYSCAIEWAWNSDPDVLLECYDRDIKRIAKDHVKNFSQHVINETYEEEIEKLIVVADDAYLNGFTDGSATNKGDGV